MNANNTPYYPFHPFYNFEHYVPFFSFSQPQISYDSSCQNYKLQDLKPAEFNYTAVDTSYKLKDEASEGQKVQSKGKKNKIPAQTPKRLKEKVQNNFQHINKNSKTIIVEQKQGRNANSNLLRMFFRRLQNKIQENPQYIQYVIIKYQMKITVDEFVEWLQTNKVDYRNYIRVPSIKKFFVSQNFTSEHTKIMRILLKHFIDVQSINCYLTSKKVRKSTMNHNYNSLRVIFKEILAVDPV